VRFRFAIIGVLTLVAVLVIPIVALAGLTVDEAAKSLPDKVGEFVSKGPAQPPAVGFFELHRPEDFGAISHAVRSYRSASGHVLSVEIITTMTDAGAFSLLTAYRSASQEIKQGLIGRAGFVEPGRIVFYKGKDLVSVRSLDQDATNSDELLAFAKALAATLDPSEDDVPVLLKHLPNWETAQTWAGYAVSANQFKNEIAVNQPILNELNFEGGTEAVVSDYGPSRLAIVEFTTPQLAGDNDRRVVAKIQELRGAGQPVPSAYRRVGNYSVFVFNAPDEKTAAQLIDQVKYEQVVQWLGENPYWFEKAQRLYARTTAGVLLTVIQSSGLSLLICLGIGGVFGVFLFRLRRTRHAEASAYSDAGGMVRLNIDQLTTETKGRKLLRPGKP